MHADALGSFLGFQSFPSLLAKPPSRCRASSSHKLLSASRNCSQTFNHTCGVHTLLGVVFPEIHGSSYVPYFRNFRMESIRSVDSMVTKRRSQGVQKAKSVLTGDSIQIRSFRGRLTPHTLQCNPGAPFHLLTGVIRMFAMHAFQTDGHLVLARTVVKRGI